MSDDSPFRRGNVYLIRFPLPDQPGRTIHKFAVCLQEGRIVFASLNSLLRKPRKLTHFYVRAY
ncbi:hypothetical protein FJZ31_24490 [Candidatus Poribacteria bacterium]|nr:hypothetical protein [Candidatus Poribacteria bacterium]